MIARKFLVSSGVALAALAGTFAFAQNAPEKPAMPGQGEMKLPAGWTAEDMQACMQAGTPGAMHEFLKKGVGVWTGKTQHWMGADATEPTVSDCTSTITSLMDGRFTHCEMKGEMPGMGMYQGLGVTGYDNVTQKFVSNWIDNHGTGIMQGVGELSGDHKTLSWSFTYNCPINKKPAVMRQVETYTSETTMTLEMFCNDPKSGKEYKCMQIDFTRKS